MCRAGSQEVRETLRERRHVSWGLREVWPITKVTPVLPPSCIVTTCPVICGDPTSLAILILDSASWLALDIGVLQDLTEQGSGKMLT